MLKCYPLAVLLVRLDLWHGWMEEAHCFEFLNSRLVSSSREQWPVSPSDFPPWKTGIAMADATLQIRKLAAGIKKVD